MAWSDAARRAAAAARRLKRVMRYEAKTSRQEDQKSYLTEKLRQRAKIPQSRVYDRHSLAQHLKAARKSVGSNKHMITDVAGRNAIARRIADVKHRVGGR